MPSAVVLKSHFAKHDTDGSGYICTQEFADLCYDLGFYMEDHEVKIAFKVLDKDQTGMISYDEFESWANSASIFDMARRECEAFEQIKEYPEWMEWLIETFQWYDTDKSGNITFDEFERLCDNFPFKPPSAWKAVDADGDGLVSFNEFMSWVFKNYESFLGHSEDMVSPAGVASAVTSIRLPLASKVLESKLKSSSDSRTDKSGSETPGASCTGDASSGAPAAGEGAASADSVAAAASSPAEASISDTAASPSITLKPGVIWVDWKSAAYERSMLNSVTGISFQGFHDDKKAPDYVPADEWIKYIIERAEDPALRVVAAVLNRSHMQHVRDIRAFCTTLGCECPVFVICTGRGKPEEFAKYGIDAAMVTKDWNKAAEIALAEVRKQCPSVEM